MQKSVANKNRRPPTMPRMIDPKEAAAHYKATQSTPAIIRILRSSMIIWRRARSWNRVQIWRSPCPRTGRCLANQNPYSHAYDCYCGTGMATPSRKKVSLAARTQVVRAMERSELVRLWCFPERHVHEFESCHETWVIFLCCAELRTEQVPRSSFASHTTIIVESGVRRTRTANNQYNTHTDDTSSSV